MARGINGWIYGDAEIISCPFIIIVLRIELKNSIPVRNLVWFIINLIKTSRHSLICRCNREVNFVTKWIFVR